MTLERLKEILDATGLPAVYRSFAKDHAPSPPYLVFYSTEENVLYADDELYYSETLISVELYTDAKAPATEKLVEDALRGAGCLWNKYENYWEDERLYEVLYEI